ncbi:MULTISPECIES: N-acetyltransferase [unclassified Meiothermus]|uniref:GNAT family N-acetyltransferase n=1 Tax=unclassified Meiothermus TaxID=370471 RepID=UPI000D7C3246|nr:MULTISPECIES: GNAT family N-acetyltransferase [unclassified Meiothermus]PZA08108.1 N-acetyltransferase [Meiothermus sp. Pnk-1]RYM29971.1 GNAT family N-acetyltransferase [Meiothermus sp. PNK-Is4]
MMFTSRPYQPPDLERLCAFLARCHQMSAVPDAFIHPGDLVWRTLQDAHYRPERGMRVWETGGETAGFVWQKQLSLDFAAAPWLAREQRRALMAAMLAYAERQARAWGLEGRLFTSVSENDRESASVLESAGYARDDDVMYSLERSLREEIPAPQLAEGFGVRHPEAHELAERVELHREVWHPSRFTLESYLNIRSAPVYRPDLDLVTLTPEGRFASYCVVWYDPLNRVGEFEPVGTRKAWERRGLGKAVLMEGFRRLRKLGAKKAVVYCYEDNLAFYRSAGFEEFNRWWGFSKPL